MNTTVSALFNEAVDSVLRRCDASPSFADSNTDATVPLQPYTKDAGAFRNPAADLKERRAISDAPRKVGLGSLAD